MAVKKFRVLKTGKAYSSITIDDGVELPLKHHYFRKDDVVVRKKGLMDDKSSVLYVTEAHIDTPEADLRDDYGRFKDGVASYLQTTDVEEI